MSAVLILMHLKLNLSKFVRIVIKDFDMGMKSCFSLLQPQRLSLPSMANGKNCPFLWEHLMQVAVSLSKGDSALCF